MLIQLLKSVDDVFSFQLFPSAGETSKEQTFAEITSPEWVIKLLVFLQRFNLTTKLFDLMGHPMNTGFELINFL